MGAAQCRAQGRARRTSDYDTAAAPLVIQTLGGVVGREVRIDPPAAAACLRHPEGKDAEGHQQDGGEGEREAGAILTELGHLGALRARS